jgi:cytochrome c oxidase cbb3-type subunit III
MMRWRLRVRHGSVAAALLALTIAAAGRLPAWQAPAQAPAQGGNRAGGFVPGQKRPPGDPVQIARGKTLYEINCRACHGADLRGGDMGGPNLLRSQVALSDLDGELIVPIIQGSRQNMGMPAIGVNPQDAKAIAAYVRSVMGTIGRQGMPPSAGKAPPSILVGNTAEGKAYFGAKCSGCHSATGDLAGIATKIPDGKTLQSTWVSGGGRRGAPQPASRATATVVLPSGESVAGELVQIDDFLVSIKLSDGTIRTVRRDGDIPKVTVQDPMKGHKDLLSDLTDQNIHDVTAYLVTLK